MLMFACNSILSESDDNELARCQTSAQYAHTVRNIQQHDRSFIEILNHDFTDHRSEFFVQQPSPGMGRTWCLILLVS